MKLRAFPFLVVVLIPLTVIATQCLAQAVAGNVYYVATTGSDSNAGTLASAFRTVNKGVSVLTPGDTVFVRAGTYNEALESSTMPGGTSWSAPITIAAYPGETVTLRPTNSVRVIGFYTANQKYIIVKGFILDAV